MSWLTMVLGWLVNFFTAAGKVEVLGKQLEDLKTSHAKEVTERDAKYAECMEKHAQSEKREHNCEDTVRRLESRLEDTINLLDATRAVATVHACDHGKITKISLGAIRLFAWKEEKALGADAFELFAPRERAKFLKLFRTALEDKQVGQIAKADLEIMTRNYETVPMTVSISAWVTEGEWSAALEFKERSASGLPHENGNG